MAKKTTERRRALRDRLIDIAEQKIISDGLESIKARDLAKEASCAVGAIYNVFGDLNDLILEVNGRTFKRLGASVSASVSGMDDDPPTERLIALSYSYLEFANDHTNAWRALFDVEMRAGGPVPEWYMRELGLLFSNIAKPVSEIYTELDESELHLMTRALFSSVHGIVLLGLQERISGVPVDKLRTMIALVLRNLS